MGDRARLGRVMDLATGALVVLLAGNAADGASTIYATSHGGREWNPIYGDQPRAAKVVAIKSAGAVAQVYLLHTLSRRGHPRLANVIAYTTGAALGGLSIRNWRQR